MSWPGDSASSSTVRPMTLEPGTTAHFDASRPHRLGADGVTTEVLVVAADGPSDFRNHPLFSTSITDH